MGDDRSSRMPRLGELRKRRMVRVCVGYLVAAWLAVQVASIALPAFGAPAWTMRATILLFALGLPFVLLAAWAIESTADGVTFDVRRRGTRRMAAVAAALAVLAIGWFAYGTRPAGQEPPSTARVPATARLAPGRSGTELRAIAVLPLVNASNDAEQQFFSDGLSESLIDSLSRFSGLRVVGRISAFQFRDSNDDSASIGRKLGVSFLLSGRVQRAGDMVRINASLVRAEDGTTIWAEHYDRPYRNLFALQDEITQAVASALHARLLPSEAGAHRDDRPPSGSLDAYNAYLQGLKHWHEEDFASAAADMARAVELDPGYALAWAQLSGSLSTFAVFNEPPSAGARMAESRLAADKALLLAPGLGAAHAARAYLHVYQLEYGQALAECRRAVQLAPDDPTVLNGCGYVFAQVGRLAEALRARQRLLGIEPLYIVNYQQYARMLIATGRLEEAERFLRTAESLPQTNPRWSFLGQVHRLTIALVRGETDAARRIALQMPGANRAVFGALVAQATPDRAAAYAALSGVMASKDVATRHPYVVAQVYALRGDAGHAVEWLARAPTRHLLFLPLDPVILQLRNDPRFTAFCARKGLPAPATIDALNIDQIRALSPARQGRP